MHIMAAELANRYSLICVYTTILPTRPRFSATLLEYLSFSV